MIDLVDKRLHLRYPITLELQYKAMKRGRVQHLGDGMTLNISSGGVLFHVNDVFETKDILPDGGMIELGIKWPLLLDEVCPLKLVVRGCIVRRDDTGLAVKTEQHEFRTACVIASKCRLKSAFASALPCRSPKCDEEGSPWSNRIVGPSFGPASR